MQITDTQFIKVFSVLLFIIFVRVVWLAGPSDAQAKTVPVPVVPRGMASSRAISGSSGTERAVNNPHRLSVEELEALKQVSRDVLASRVVNPGSYTEPEMVSFITDAGLGHVLVDVLKRSMCESSWDPNKPDYKTGTHIGLMQISIRNARHFGYTKADLYDPQTNLRIAKLLYEEKGDWSPWSDSDRCVRKGPKPYYNWRWLRTK